MHSPSSPSQSNLSVSSAAESILPVVKEPHSQANVSELPVEESSQNESEGFSLIFEEVFYATQSSEEKNVEPSGAEIALKESTVAEIPLENSIDRKERRHSEGKEKVFLPTGYVIASELKESTSVAHVRDEENIPTIGEQLHTILKRIDSDSFEKDMEQVRSLVAQKANVEIENNNSLTPFLQLITDAAPIEVVKKFIEIAKPNLLARNSKGENALHIAINQKMNYVGYLLEKAPQLVRQRNHNDQTPLHYVLFGSSSVANYYASIFEKYENDVLALDDANITPLYLMLAKNVSRFIEYNFKRCLKEEIPGDLFCDVIEKAIQILPGLKNISEDGVIEQITDLLGKWVDIKSKLTLDKYLARCAAFVETDREEKTESDTIGQFLQLEPNNIMFPFVTLASQYYSNPKFQSIVNSLIYFAVKHNRTRLLKGLLFSSKDAAELNPFVIRALEIVLKEGKFDTLKIFIDSYSNPTVKNQIIKFTLHTLMKENSPEFLLRFILDDDAEKIKKLKGAAIYTDLVFLLTAAVNKHGMSCVNKLVSEILASNAEIKFFPDLLNWGIQLYKGLSVEDQKEDKEYSTFLSIVKNGPITTDTWEEKKVKIQELQKSSFNRTSDRPLESVKKSFEEKSNIVKIPLEKAEVEYITNQYRFIKSYEETLTYKKNSDLQAELHRCALNLRQNPDHYESKLQLIAMLSEYMRIVYGVVPHDTQMINLLALLNAPHLINKRLAQIKSGEGKSLLIAMLSAYSALAHGDPKDIKKSEKVDIITASSDLAVRDAEHYAPYYGILGLESGHNTHGKGKAEIPGGSTISEANILYGTSSSFIHHHLQLQVGGNNEHRNLDTVIVDEFDNSVLDDLTNFVIGYSNPACLQEVVEEVLSFMDGEAKEKNVDTLKKHLKNMFDLSFPDEFINAWISAYRLLPKKKLGESYVNENGTIKIVNYENSGELLHGSRWSNFLHCFLELRNGVPFNRDSLSHAEMSFVYYINKYKRLYGMTGTLGNETERKTIEALLQVDQTDSKQKIYYDSPTHLPCQIKLDEKGHILTDDKSHDDAVINAVIEKIRLGRPVHLICETIKETNRLYELLSKRVEVRNGIQVYNDMQNAMPDEILAAAGKPGAITITTNIGGRGSNIVVSPEVAKIGGLHVISTYLPYSKRTEEQNFMRTARHGQPGTYQYIVPLSEFSKFGIEYKGKTSEELFVELDAARERRAADTLEPELYRKHISDIVYRVQDVFFDLPAEFKLDLEDIWKETIADILEIARKYYLKGAADPKNIVNAEQEITRRMEKFWQGSQVSEWGRSAIYASPRHFAEHKKKDAIVDLFARQTKESKETNSTSSHSLFDASMPDIKGFVADMDHTCLGIHTSGIALSTNPEDLRKNFKGPPEALIKLLKSIHEKGIPIGIATFGTEIELVNADGVPYKPLFASGRKSVEEHFAALLGDDLSKKIISNIQAYQVEDKKIIQKTRRVLSHAEYVSLSKTVAECRDAITEINNREKDESIQKMQVQAVYDKLNIALDKLKKPTFDEAKREEKDVLLYGKNPHLAQFKRELGLDRRGIDNSQIIFLEDDCENRALARYAGYQVVKNVAKRDGLAWVPEVGKIIFSKKALTDSRNEDSLISRNYLASIGIKV